MLQFNKQSISPTLAAVATLQGLFSTWATGVQGSGYSLRPSQNTKHLIHTALKRKDQIIVETKQVKRSVPKNRSKRNNRLSAIAVWRVQPKHMYQTPVSAAPFELPPTNIFTLVAVCESSKKPSTAARPTTTIPNVLRTEGCSDLGMLLFHKLLDDRWSEPSTTRRALLT